MRAEGSVRLAAGTVVLAGLPRALAALSALAALAAFAIFAAFAAAACAVFMTSLLAQAWRLCVLSTELKANHRFLQQSWHVKTKEGADFDLAKTVLT